MRKAKMKNTILTKIMGLLLAVAAGGCLWLGYSAHSLSRQREALQQELTRLESREKLMQKKIAEEKALAGRYQQAQSDLQDELRKADARIAEVSREKEVAEARLAEVKQQQQPAQDNAELLATIDKLKENIAQWKTSFDDLREESVSNIREREEKNATLAGENQKLSAALKQETQQHNRCKTNNAALAGLSRELVEKYEKKNAMDSLSTREPLTQFEKIELEKMVQEYLDKIDKQTL
jgi:chromosome segregation ATPase